MVNQVLDAIIRGSVSDLHLALKACPECVDSRDPSRKGRSTLHLAVENSALEMVTVLLEAGAEHRAQDNEGNTALHLAVFGKNLAMVELLLHQGADPAIPNNCGFDSFIAAVSGDDKEIATILRKSTYSGRY